MTKKELLNILQNLGWKNINGNQSSILYLQDRVIKVLPYLRKYGNDFYFSLDAGVGREDFSRAEQYITQEKRKYPFSYILDDSSNDFYSNKVLEINETLIHQKVEKIINWAKVQDLQAGIDAYAALPTNSIGVYPVYHLAALAVNKDQATLLNYLTHFKAGDRLDFVPYITQDYIERAYELACK